MDKTENESNHINSWKVRDGRQECNFDSETEGLIKKHIEYFNKKETLNVQMLEDIDFNILYVSQSENITRSIDYTHTKLCLFENMNGMPHQLAENINNLKYQYMTPIQNVVISYIQREYDLIASSETGSGKTVAYLFPLIGNMLIKGPPQISQLVPEQGRPTTLILVPTRELAEQVYTEAKKLSYKTGIKTVKIYGGVPYNQQESDVKEGVDILVATPGRLIDFLNKGKVTLEFITTVILDEADRLLDMGFEDSLKSIIVNYRMPNKDKRVNLMFSATFSSQVKEVAKKFLNNFYVIEPKNPSPRQIIQEVIKANNSEKNSQISSYLKSINGSSLIFLSTKRGVDLLAQHLTNEHFNIVSIHGDRTQWQRQNAIQSFTTGSTEILIATDVASRGLDFPNVKYVINFDLPKNLDDYIHRIGRTGRMGQFGTAVSFVSEEDKGVIRKLYEFMKEQKQSIPSWFEEMCNNIRSDFIRGNRFNNKSCENVNSSNYYNTNNTRERSRDNY